VPTEAVELASAAHAAGWWGGSRLGDRLARYLGPRVLVAAHGYLSPDGTRRVRFVPGERRVRFEEIDAPSGITRRSHRVRSCGVRSCGSAVHFDAPAPLTTWHARLLGRSTEQVCFDGLPRALGGQPRATQACMVRLVESLDGVRVERVGAAGNVEGDSWHPSLQAALGQLEYEYGSHVGRLREGRGRAGAGRVRAAWS